MADTCPLNRGNPTRASVAVDTFSSIGRIARNISVGLALSLPLAVAWAQPAQAVLIFNFYESGSDLVVEGTGSLVLPASSLGPGFSGGGSNGRLGFNNGYFFTGLQSPIEAYGITGPSTLGVGIQPINVFASSNSGINLLLVYGQTPSRILIDGTYVSGAAINSSSTFSGITLASLGMPNSGILGTWTLDGTGDTISVQVNASASPASVPGPLPILGLAAAFGFSRKLRKRIKLHKGTSDISASTGA